ncbi:MAG: glycosyltransferase family 87 protein [Planctomycetota bacterium]
MTPTPSPQPDATPGRNRQASRRVWTVVACVVLLIGSGLFVQRGVIRGLEGSYDFTMIYAGAMRLVDGQDPYVFDATYDDFVAAGGEGRPRDPERFAMLYPPFSYAVLTPLGALNWPAAKTVWLMFNLVATAAVGAWLIRHRPRPRNTQDDPSTTKDVAWWPIALMLGLWLGCASLHTAVAFGQLAVVPLALMLPALRPWSGRDEVDAWPWRSVRTAGGGLMLAVAGALKPQLAVLLAALLLATPRWRLAVWSLGWAVGIALASTVWIQITSPSWLEHWGDQLAFFTASGQAIPTLENRFTYQMINLEPWLHRLWPGGAGPVELIGWSVLFIGIAVGFASGAILEWSKPRWGVAFGPDSFRNRWDTEDFLLLAVSLGAAITLLIDYHRTYDAVLLVLPALWAWRRLSACPRDVLAWMVAAGVATFMLPGPSILTSFARRGWIPETLTESWAWQAWLLPHHNVALLIVAVALGWRVLRRGPAPSTPENRGETSPARIADHTSA